MFAQTSPLGGNLVGSLFVIAMILVVVIPNLLLLIFLIRVWNFVKFGSQFFQQWGTPEAMMAVLTLFRSQAAQGEGPSSAPPPHGPTGWVPR